MYMYVNLFSFRSKELPAKDIDRVNYIYNLYDNILQFLTKYGAYLCHVQPQFLLNYEEYIVLLESSRSKVIITLNFLIEKNSILKGLIHISRESSSVKFKNKNSTIQNFQRFKSKYITGEKIELYKTFHNNIIIIYFIVTGI